MRGGGYKEGPPEWHAHGGPDAHEFGGSDRFLVTVDQTSSFEGFEARDGCIGNLPFSRINHSFSTVMAVASNLVFVHSLLGLKFTFSQSPVLTLNLLIFQESIENWQDKRIFLRRVQPH